VKKVKLEHTNISVNYPSIDYFLDKLRSGIPYYFLKINHGIIDAYVETYQSKGRTSDLIELLKYEQYRKIAEELYRDFADAQWGFKHYNLNSDSVIDKLEVFTKVFFGYKNHIPKLEMGISAGVGLGDVFGTYPSNHIKQLGRFDILKLATEVNADSEYFHSGLFKHYSIMGEADKLFQTANECGYDVVMLGPPYLRLFGERFNIDKFHHIQIPPKGAIDYLDEFIDELLEIHNDKTLFLPSCGHILSTYILDKIKDINIIGMDMGRSFDWDIREHQSNQPTMAKGDVWISPHHQNGIPTYGDISIPYKEYINNLRNG
jgi:hypothetical protein